jgi:hypothetical protein
LTTKTSLILALVLAASVTSHGQGTVYFANSSTTGITNLATGQGISPREFKVTLYYLPVISAGEDPSSWSFINDFNARAIPVATSSVLLPGMFAGGVVRADYIAPAGDYGWFQVRAWEFAYGLSYEEVLNNPTFIHGRLGYLGTSNIIKVDTGDPTSVPPGIPGDLVSSGLKPFFVGTPEPSVIGLGALAFGAVLLFRRRL